MELLTEGEIKEGLLQGYGRKIDFIQKYVFRGYFLKDGLYGKGIMYRYGKIESEGLYIDNVRVKYQQIDSFLENTDPNF